MTNFIGKLFSNSEKYTRREADPFKTNLFKFYHFSIALIIIYAISIQIAVKYFELLYWIFAIFLVVWHLTLGFLSFLNIFPKLLKNKTILIFRFLINYMIIGLLLFYGKGSFEYFILFMPWLLVMNLYVVEINLHKGFSVFGTIYVILVFSSIQFFTISNDLLHISSTIIKSLLLVFVSFISFAFWFNREIEFHYYKSIKNLHNIGQILTSYTGKDNIIQKIAKEATYALGVDIVTIAQYDHKKKILYEPCYSGNFCEPDEKSFKFRADDVLYKILELKKDIYFKDVRNERIAAGDPPDKRTSKKRFVYREKIVSSAFIRLILQEKMYGLMVFNFRKSQNFDFMLKQRIKIFANYAAIAIKNTVERKYLQRSLDFSIMKVHEIKDQLSKSTDTQENEIINMILFEILNLLEEELGFFATYYIERNQLIITNYSTKYEEFHEHSCRTTPNSFIGPILSSKRYRIMNSRKEVPEYKPFRGDGPDKDVQSAVAVPLIIKDEIFGIFMIESNSKNNFTMLDVSIIISMIEEAAIALNYSRLLNDFIKSEKLIETLKGIDSRILDKSFDLKQTLSHILQRGLHDSKVNTGNILLEKNQSELIIVESTRVKNINVTLKKEKCISGEAFRRSETINISDMDNDPLKEKFYNAFDLDTKSELAVPLQIGDDVIGVINFESPISDSFGKIEEKAIKVLAGQAAVAIHMAKLLQKSKNRAEELKSLREIDDAILNSKLGLDNTLSVILNKGLELLKNRTDETTKQLHGDIIFRMDDNNNYLIVKKSTDPDFEGTKLNIYETISGICFNSKQIVYIQDLERKVIHSKIQGVYYPDKDEIKRYHPHPQGEMMSELVIPLLVEDKIIGVYNIESEQPSAFDLDDISILRNLSKSAALAIQNAQIFEEIEKSKKKLENSIDKELLSFSTKMSRSLKHRLNNSVGLIKRRITDLLDQQEIYDKKTIEILNIVKQTSQKVLDFREEHDNIISNFSTLSHDEINFTKLEQDIRQNELIFVGNDIELNISGLSDLSGVKASYKILLEGVFLELIDNAVKAMKYSGKIDIVGEKQEKLVQIKISDNGCGISADDRTKIFEREFSNWEFLNKKGHGNGLYYLKNIVDFYNGDLEVSSIINEGSTFILKFPISIV